MAIPPNARPIPQPLDPADVLDMSITLSRGDADTTPPPFLVTDEEIASFTLTLPGESVAAGLVIRTGAPYPGPTLIGDVLVFWLAVDQGAQQSTIFSGAGVTLPIEFTATTTHVPPRIKQRTITVTVAQQ